MARHYESTFLTRSIIIGCLLGALLSFSSVVAAQEMTMEEAIRIGLRNNYDIRIARNSADVAANNRGKGTAGFLPTIDLSGGYQRTTTDEGGNFPFGLGDNDAENWNSDISLSWTLFDGFRMFADKKRYNALAVLGEYQARLTIEQSVVAISRAYLNLVQQEQLLDVDREARDISGTRLERERVRHDLGGASSTDFLNAQVAFNADQSALLTRELNVEIAREDLNLLLGQDPATPLIVSKEIVIPELGNDFESLLAEADQKNSTLIVTRQNKEVADRLVLSSRAPFLPRLSLNTGYSWSDRTITPDLSGSDINTESSDARIGLTLSMNLFNGGRDRIEWRNARLEARNQELALRDAENQLAGTVRKTFETYSVQMKLVQLEEQNVEAARRNLDLQQNRYRLGATGSIEFRDAQVSFIRVQTALIVARYQARISRLELETRSSP